MRQVIGLMAWRTIVLWSLMFWQGGFLFYASAVVPSAQNVIGHRQQGFITRRVVHWINSAAVISLGLLAIDMALFPDRRRRWPGWSLWLAAAATQAALFVLVLRMDPLLDPEMRGVELGFRPLHRTYLWIHTGQWVVAIALSVTLLNRWRRRDAHVPS